MRVRILAPARLIAIIMENITQEQFNAYEKVRRSGATNMFDVHVVSDLSGLGRDTILLIMENYGALKKKFDGGYQERHELD